MLLLAAAADAEMRAARRHPLRAAAQQAFELAFGEVALVFGQLDFRLLARQYARHEHRFAVVARHAPPKGSRSLTVTVKICELCRVVTRRLGE